MHVDPSITLKDVRYGQVTGGWCEDIDGDQQHLKSSLELGAIVLNYLHSLVENPGVEEEDQESTAIERVDHIGGK